MSGNLSKLDANQVIRQVFDDAAGALKTIPADSSSFAISLTASSGDNVATIPLATDTQTLLNAESAGSSTNSLSVSILNNLNYCVAINWSGLSGTLNATATLQASLDGTVWVTAPGSSAVTLNSASGAAMLNVTDATYKFFRVAYAAGGVTGGTYSVKYLLKG